MVSRIKMATVNLDRFFITFFFLHYVSTALSLQGRIQKDAPIDISSDREG